jgi:hypothetical protein
MVSKEQKPSKSTKKSSSKKKSRAINIPSLPTTVLSEEQKKIRDLILHAQVEFAKVKTNIIKDKHNEIAALESQIKEFMGPFMLIGYDISNNPVELVSASSPAEHDALLERFRRVMFKINQNIANSGGEDPYGHQNTD